MPRLRYWPYVAYGIAMAIIAIVLTILATVWA